ncbi:hypothetical protein [uncultured Dokdonia sp.]|uniref:hypothetical protein n=1 Tax=uncultured Dokdonia sp. TaxID=575653 RepID=UPI0030ED9473
MRYFYIFLFISSLAVAQSTPIKGVVIPQVTFDNESNDYSLFLPANYTDTATYPVVVIYDELGRGASAVQQFSIGAGLTESIVASPNYRLNDTLSVAIDQSKEFIEKLSQTYAVNKDKIILSGYGRDGLIVTSQAQADTSIYGVIAIGNAFLDKKSLRSNENLKIALLSPDEGSQYYKLRSYSRNYGLRKNLVSYHTYDGIVWPSAGYIAEALTAIFIDETTSDEKLQSYYNSDLAFGKTMYRKQEGLDAYDFVSTLKDKYKKRLDIDEQKELLDNIKRLKNYRSDRDIYAMFSYGEDLMAEEFQYNIREDMSNSYFNNLGWWSYQMDELDIQIDSTDNAMIKRKSAMRLKRFVQSEVELQYKILQRKDTKIEQLLFANVLRSLVNPNNQDAFIQSISLSAREGDVNATWFYLEELLKTGYTDYEALYKIPYTTAARISKEWNEIIKAYLGKSKYY